MKKRVVRVLVLSLLLLAESSSWAQSTAMQRLFKWINAPGPVTAFDFDAVAIPSLEVGPAAIPNLRDFLDRSDNPDRRRRALMALVWIGGDSAISILDSERQNGVADLEWLVAFTLPSVDSPQNRELLIDLLRRTPSSPIWNSTNTLAAWSLGILRAEEAVESLREATQLEPRGWNYAAAIDALFWIEHGNWIVDIPEKTDEDRMFTAILRTGIPGIHEEQYYMDGNHGGFLHFDSSGWRFSESRPGGKDSRTRIRFAGSISSDGSRAIMDVPVMCEGNCGTTYSYLLRKDGDEWKVLSLRVTGAW